MTENNKIDMRCLGQQAKQAGYALARLNNRQKQRLLEAIAAKLIDRTDAIVAANQNDLAQARAKGIGDAMLDRLLLDKERLNAVIGDIDNVVKLADPIGREFDNQILDNGLRLSKRQVPLGVIGVIYEARPNVTVDIAVLALKTGNAVILRGGKETLQSNIALSDAIREALVEQGLPADGVQLIQSTDRSLVSELLKLDDYVDMIVPRGGPNLQRLCAQEATIPVILGGAGVCHLYVDQEVDIDKSIAVVTNAKIQRPTVCNALDTLLVHHRVADEFLSKLYRHLESLGVKFYADEAASAIAAKLGVKVENATQDSFNQEWLSLTLGIKIVQDTNEAIEHIRRYTSGHSDGILTDNIHTSVDFVNRVDTAAVYVNASIRFTDGGQFGLGAEVAVSTQKLHARGPMGLDALTTYKWIAQGDYSVRD